MKNCGKILVCDTDLGVTAYRLTGTDRGFPSHFHEFYVLGYLETGERRLSCKGERCTVSTGDVLIFNPRDSHGCVQAGGVPLDYRGLNVPRHIMAGWAEAATGLQGAPDFACSVLRDADTAAALRSLHEKVLRAAPAVDKETDARRLAELLMARCAPAPPAPLPAYSAEIARVCAYIEAHYAEPIPLSQLCCCAGLSRSTLLRAFSKAKGITPYRYLESIRVAVAKKCLEQGASPLEAAMAAGFSDQSHLTHYFTRFTGLSPRAYRDMFRQNAEKEETPYEK